MSYYWKNVGVKSLLGKTLTQCYQGSYYNDDAIYFIVDDSERYIMYHDQDCCESVAIEDIVGDLQDLIGSPLLEAEESSNSGDVEEGCDDTFTWTYYKFGTIKGHVNIRWYGSSNGYYSESVNLKRMENA